MTGPEHFRAAERLLAGRPKTAGEYARGIEGDSPWPPSEMDLRTAQVHATLALAAASALLSGAGGVIPLAEYDAWAKAAGEPEAAVTAEKE